MHSAQFENPLTCHHFTLDCKYNILKELVIMEILLFVTIKFPYKVRIFSLVSGLLLFLTETSFLKVLANWKA